MARKAGVRVGLGAKIGGDFKLGKGEDLLIAVGGEGTNGVYSGGGGGGSFVVEKLPNPLRDIPLVIAGGGGGSGGGGGGGGTAGGAGGGSGGGGGGTGGNGGADGGGAYVPYGAGGGGFLTSGGSSTTAQGGGSFFTGLAGGGGAGASAYGGSYGNANGGFGGGGGGGNYGGGGGGGYSGGGGGVLRRSGGGGGGSFDAGTKKILDAAFNSGNGLVRITELAETRPRPGASTRALPAAIRRLEEILRRCPSRHRPRCSAPASQGLPGSPPAAARPTALTRSFRIVSARISGRRNRG